MTPAAINKQTQQQTGGSYQMISQKQAQSLRSMSELLSIKERIEADTVLREQERKRRMAEMFLAGPEAWPDYPFDENCIDEDLLEDEEWIPLDCQD
jgi:hypothetical protein